MNAEAKNLKRQLDQVRAREDALRGGVSHLVGRYSAIVDQPNADNTDLKDLLAKLEAVLQSSVDPK